MDSFDEERDEDTLDSLLANPLGKTEEVEEKEEQEATLELLKQCLDEEAKTILESQTNSEKINEEPKEVDESGDNKALTPIQVKRRTLRFMMELEFVECCSNLRYLQSLSQREYLENEKFLNYIEYLQHWRRPEMAKNVRHVHALQFLELLTHKNFREKLKDQAYLTFVEGQQHKHWLYGAEACDP